MTPEEVLAERPLVLDQRTRARYFEDGFLTVPAYVGAAWLDRLRAVVAAKIEESPALTASDDEFDLAPDHSADRPNLRRLRKAVDRHPALWALYSAADALHAGAGADAHRPARAGPRAGAGAHGAVPGQAAAALGPGRLPLDLRRAVGVVPRGVRGLVGACPRPRRATSSATAAIRRMRAGPARPGSPSTS
jgi:hypothetical protein